ncbi:hypothetical protein Rsub_12930 [Raphidocelis subcapitata]|uniref:Major facilitator superfamily (MFS) profile domain-containing protein n=1 Tax=Raphidocelis subcapitata TaxID=307507 RepID=A0A2V0PM66_9CHLO|nr:hypothetical protein Rsub_12930 [Raphidocelis subcapitata]|eukprot:GBG00173.1 hypothetical protein Rsub_12930 [Raphidocelis subcapitata]
MPAPQHAHAARQAPAWLDAAPPVRARCCALTNMTPPVWLVVWMAASVGFLVGTSNSVSQVFLPAFLEQHFPETRPLMGEYLSAFRGSTCTLAPMWRVRLFIALQPACGAVGALAAMPLTHLRGRKMGIACGIGLFLLAEVLQFASTAEGSSLPWVGRSLGGFGDGVMLQATYLEVIEISHPNTRGRLTAFVGVGRTVGLLCAGLLTFGMGTARKMGWRFVHIWSLWPGLVVLACLAWMPETPASLIQRGRVAEGRQALHQIRGPWHPDIENEVAALLLDADLPTGPKRLRLLARREHMPALLVGALLGVVTGWPAGVMLFVTPFMLGTSLSLKQADLVGSVITTLGLSLGTLFGMAFIDSAGRRRLLAVSFFGVGAVAFSNAFLIRQLVGDDSAGYLKSEGSASWATAALVSLSYVFGGIGPETSFFAFVSETHTLATRTLGCSLALSVFLGVRAVSSFFGLPLICVSGAEAFGGLAAAFIGGIVPLALLLMIEPARAPLEGMQELWARHWLWGACFGRPVRAPPPVEALRRLRRARRPSGGGRGGAGGRPARGGSHGGGEGGGEDRSGSGGKDGGGGGSGGGSDPSPSGGSPGSSGGGRGSSDGGRGSSGGGGKVGLCEIAEGDAEASGGSGSSSRGHAAAVAQPALAVSGAEPPGCGAGGGSGGPTG